MNSFMHELIGTDEISWSDFEPVARYHPHMDVLLYLKEDCGYRADRVDVYLTVLWHPQEERLVGIKLKGFKFVFHQLQSIADIKDAQFLPLVKALEMLLVHGVAQSMMDEVEGKRIRQRYEAARDFAKGVQVPATVWMRAA